jgi:hypothetical protein
MGDLELLGRRYAQKGFAEDEAVTRLRRFCAEGGIDVRIGDLLSAIVALGHLSLPDSGPIFGGAL